MKKILRNSILFVLLATFASSCSNKVDLQGPYQENMYVFGMLDASAPTQKIKIYKVFSGANGTQSSQILDSIYYKPNDLDVKLVTYNASGKEGAKIPLLYANNSSLNPNGPYNPNDAVYYYTNTKISSDSTYKLVVKSKNKTVESSIIKVADSCNFQNVFPGIATFNSELVYRDEVYAFLDTTRIYFIKFAESKNVKGINCKVKFTYGNYASNGLLINTGSSTYDLKNISFSSLLNENIQYSIDQNDFLRYWGQTIPDEPSVFVRRTISFLLHLIMRLLPSSMRKMNPQV
jgi:hypothetical protein